MSDSHNWDAPITFENVLNSYPPLAPAVAALGIAAGGQPVFLDFRADSTRHVLVIGDAGAGKTALLRTMAMSLVLYNRQAQIQLLAADIPPVRGSASPYAPLQLFNYLPHMWFPVLESPEAACELLAFVVEEMHHRCLLRADTPRIILFIDDVGGLLVASGERAQRPLVQLLQGGHTAGIHLVLSTRDTEDLNSISTRLNAYAPTRIVGTVGTATTAHKVTGTVRARADYLRGAGDFLAVVGGTIIPFQAAYLSESDFVQYVQTLYG